MILLVVSSLLLPTGDAQWLPSGKKKYKRGLRQGDPLSLMLFNYFSHGCIWLHDKMAMEEDLCSCSLEGHCST